MYCTIDDAYRKAGITTAEISREDMVENILDAEAEVDRVTKTTYWSTEYSGTATDAGSGTDTLEDTGANFGSVRTNVGDYVWIHSGTGSDQMQKIIAHTNTELTVEDDWDVALDSTSEYRVIHCGHNPIVTEVRDGDETTSINTNVYPIRQLLSVTIDGTSVTTSYVNIYSNEGQLVLGSSAEESRWDSSKPQNNTLAYRYGVYDIPREIRKMTAIKAALESLGQQMGGTHNVPSTYSLPEGSVSIGQAYVNIKTTIDSLNKQYNELVKVVTKYHSFA